MNRSDNMYTYITKGTCSKKITFDIIDNKVYNIKFEGGCPGNLKLISKVFEGQDVDRVVDVCKGNICGFKNTSCGDQLAKALEEVKNCVA